MSGRPGSRSHGRSYILTSAVFSPDTFYFLTAEFNQTDATVKLRYCFDDGPILEERLRFPGARLPLDAQRREALALALQNLHLAAGVSYYKAGVPPSVQREGGGLPAEAADFFQRFYRHGLGEFAYQNRLSLDRVRFPLDATKSWTAHLLALRRHAVVPLGGGKDSLVALELMRASGQPFSLISVGDSPLIRAVARRAGVHHIRIQRTLAPELFELNRRGAYNGHVPVTGIIAFILVCAAILYDFDTVVMANERSASSANLSLPDGSEVNHQYSKSLDFERDFADYCRRHILSSLRYFSLLRPWSELAIAERFSRLPQYFDVFSSCNRNFRISGDKPAARWCRDCPKCRFVFLTLAPFVERQRLIALFDGNLLDDPKQRAGYDALIGHGAHKPFECVGEEAESLAAFIRLSRRAEWQDDALVQRFRDTVLPALDAPEGLVREAMTPSKEHRVPPEFVGLLHETG